MGYSYGEQQQQQFYPQQQYQMLQQRYGQQQYVQQYGRQFSQQQQTLQQRGYEQNALDNKRTSYQAGFINTPLITVCLYLPTLEIIP